MAVMEAELPALGQANDFIWSFVRIRKALRHEFEARLEPFGLTVPQFLTLHRLWSGDGIPISVLAAEVHSVGGTMTGVLDRMEARGLLRRERSIEDRRAVRVYLTEAGRELEGPLMALIDAVEELALRGLTSDERREIVRLLKRVGESFDGQ